MLVNFDATLVDAFGEEYTSMKFVRADDGKKIKDPNDETGYKREEVVVKVSTPIVNSLYASLEKDKEMDGKSANALHSLAQRILEGGEREYSMEELVDIKERVLKTQPRIIYARVCECIRDEPKKVEA